MASEQSQRPQTLRYQSNTTFLIGPNASSVPGGPMLPGQLQRSSQSAVTATPSGHAWPSQSPQGLGAETPALATIEASELLEVGSNTTIAPPAQPTRYAPTTLRRSQMTTSMTEVSPVGGTDVVAPGSFVAPVGSLGSVPPAPSTYPGSYAPIVSGWAVRGPRGSMLRRPNMPALVMDSHGYGSSARSTGNMTAVSRQPYFATSMTEAPGSVAISSVGVIECPSPRNSLAGSLPVSQLLRPPLPCRSLSPGTLPTRPAPMGRRFPLSYDEEIQRRPPSGVDFRDQDRFDEGYDSVETVGGQRDSNPPLSRLPASNADFPDRERTDEGFDSTETIGRQPPPRHSGSTRSRSRRRQINVPCALPAAGSKSGSGLHVTRIRMFQVERDSGAAAADAETRMLTYETHDGIHDVTAKPAQPPQPPPQLSYIPDESTFDDNGPSRPRVCNCPGTVMIRRRPPRRSTSGRLRGVYLRNDDDDDTDADDLYMIKMSKKKKKRKQPPPPSPPAAPATSRGILGFLCDLLGGRQQPPPPPPRQADSDSDDESDFELRRFDRHQLENLVRKMEMKQAASDDESKEGRKAKKREKMPEEKEAEQTKPDGKASEPEKTEEKPPEVKAQPVAVAAPGAAESAKPAVLGAPATGQKPPTPGAPAGPGAPAPVTPTKPAAPGAPATPTRPTAPGATPTRPAAPGATPTRPIARVATPTRLVAPGATPTRLVAPGATPTRPVAPGATPTRPVARGATPTRPVARGATPTRPVARVATPTRPVAPGARPTRPAAPGTTPTRPAALGTTPTRPPAPGATPTRPPAPGATPTRPPAPGATPTRLPATGALAIPTKPPTTAAAAAPMEGPLDVKVPVVFVFGGPGSGKGTQCDKIVAKYGFTHISSGDLLRAEVASGSDRGKQINDIMKQGQLAPLDMILQLIKETIKKGLLTAKGFLIDGYPRNVEQGERFESDVCKCTNLIYFEVSDDTMKARLLKRGQTSGRVDDNEDTIVKRIKTFHDESEPVLQKYKSIVRKISAEDDPEKVFASVTAVMDDIIKPK